MANYICSKPYLSLYMAVLNVSKVYYACLYGNNENEFIIRMMDRDLDIEADLIAEEEYFWNEQVVKKAEPPYTEKPDLVLESIRRRFGPAEKELEAVSLKKKHKEALVKYLELKAAKSETDSRSKKIEEEMKQAYAGIVEELGISCVGILKDGNEEYTVTYNPAYRTAIDRKGLEKLKIQHSAVYDEYVSTTESRRFSVRKKETA